jgi:uncharacterized membrane protein
MNEIHFIGGIPWWLVLLVAACALALLLLQHRQLRRRLSTFRSLLLTAFRGCVYFLLILFLFNPSLVEKRTTKLRRALVVLLDTSESMALPSASSQGQVRSRLDTVKEKLLSGKEPALQRLSRDYDLRVFELNADVRRFEPASLTTVQPRGKGSRILTGLREASREPGAAGVILFSDGIANGEKPPDEGATLPVSVIAVGAGDPEGFADVRIAHVAAPDFAFRGREVKFEATVQAFGMKGKSIPLFFNRGHNLISTRTVNVDHDVFEEKILLSYTPREIGSQSFALSLTPQPGEMILPNNRKDFMLDVRRDKIRILTLSGAPSWNYRFLRMALKQDPLVDLVSFVFLRTPTDSVDVPDTQLSLIPFPADEIFLEEIKNFDVIVFDDFSHRSYFNILYLEKVRDFVRNGGGLAMLGGIRSFDSGGYKESPFNDLLPVELDGKGRFQIGVRMQPLLTAAGRTHPVTRLAADGKTNEEMWRKMPGLTTYNQVGRSRGETLLLASTDGAGAGVPLLSVGKFGKGRTLALMSDDVWRWSFIAVGRKESPQNHLKLIRQSIRWLAQEPSLEQVQVVSTGGAKSPGEKMQFKARVLKDDFTPAPHAAVRLRVVTPEGEKIPLQVVPEGEEYSAEFTPAREGAYRVEVEADLAGVPLGKDGKNFQVAFPYGETEDGRPRFEFLRAIAESSRGEFVPMSQWNESKLQSALDKLEKLSPSEIVEQRQIYLWNNLWVFGLVLALLSAEWWLRRSWGMI